MKLTLRDVWGIVYRRYARKTFESTRSGVWLGASVLWIILAFFLYLVVLNPAGSLDSTQYSMTNGSSIIIKHDIILYNGEILGQRTVPVPAHPGDIVLSLCGSFVMVAPIVSWVIWMAYHIRKGERIANVAVQEWVDTGDLKET